MNANGWRTNGVHAAYFRSCSWYVAVSINIVALGDAKNTNTHTAAPENLHTQHKRIKNELSRSRRKKVSRSLWFGFILSDQPH